MSDEVRENDQVQAQANGDVEGSKNDETQALNDQRAEYVHDPEVHGRDFRVEGNDVRDYIGVDPEYMTYANPTEGPSLTDTERFLYTDQYDHLEGNADEDPIETSEEEIVEYDAKVDVTQLSDDEVIALEYADEDGDGRDDDTGLTEEEFKRYQDAARSREEQLEADFAAHEESSAASESERPTLGFPQ